VWQIENTLSRDADDLARVAHFWARSRV